ERISRNQLRLSTAVELGVLRNDVGDLGCVLWPEFAFGPQARVLGDHFFRPAVRVPGEGDKELDRELHRLQVADVHDPDAVGAVFVSEVHLLPDLGDGNGVEPLVGARIADIIEVVVNSGAAGALALVRRGQATNISQLSSHQSRVTSSGTRMPFS